MIVECPRCRARYRVETSVLDRDQTFKCSRCSHIFAYESESGSGGPELEPSHAAPPPASEPRYPEPSRVEPRKPAERRDADSLSFSFSPTSGAPSPSHAEPEGIPPPQAPPQGTPADRGFSFVEDDEKEDPSGALDDVDDVGSAEHGRASDEPRFVRGEEELRVEVQEQSGRDARRPYLLYLTTLVILYAILALDLLNHPAQTAKLLAGVPIVGGMLAEDHLLQTRVQLQDVEGAYQQIKDERLVFIVSGRAVNTAAESLKGVQIESAIYDQNGTPLETKSIYCGNAMSLKIVKDLSTKEISLLQRLEPPKRFEIRPGESAGFSVVFLNPPRGLKEFTARVAAAQSSAS
ncbi:MAG TPA: DUF3426 domain-containing protein [Candidatus Binatia bacterium]|nr:DUF3426 domain-containing protein [Candidatus Binatia bacterium]